MEDIFATAIYCDDIRPEIGGKQSFMGVYNSDLILSELPATLPKFCILIKVQFPIDTNAERLLVKVLDGETVIAEVAPPDGALQIPRPRPSTPLDVPKEDRILTFATAIQFAPLILNQATTLRVRVMVDNREFKANGIIVRLPTDEERGTNLLAPR